MSLWVIASKFPDPFHAVMGSGEVTTVEELLSRLVRKVKGWKSPKLAPESGPVATLSASVQKKDESVQVTTVKPTTSAVSLQTEVQLSTPQAQVKEPQKPPHSCVFCNENHFNAKCIYYKTPKHRQHRVEQLSSRQFPFCQRCMSRGHATAACRCKDRICYSCGEKGHHRLLCQNPKSKDEVRKKISQARKAAEKRKAQGSNFDPAQFLIQVLTDWKKRNKERPSGVFSGSATAQKDTGEPFSPEPVIQQLFASGVSRKLSPREANI